MRTTYVDPGLVRRLTRDLDSAAEDIKAARQKVDHPADDFPRRNELVMGVKNLLEDADLIIRKCRRISDAVEESLHDLAATDEMVNQAAQLAKQVDGVAPNANQDPV